MGARYARACSLPGIQCPAEWITIGANAPESSACPIATPMSACQAWGARLNASGSATSTIRGTAFRKGRIAAKGLRVTTIFTTQLEDYSPIDDVEIIYVPLCSRDCRHGTRSEALSCAIDSAEAMAVECVEILAHAPMLYAHWDDGWAGYYDGTGSPLSVALTHEMVSFIACDGEERGIFVIEVVLPGHDGLN